MKVEFRRYQCLSNRPHKKVENYWFWLVKQKEPNCPDCGSLSIKKLASKREVQKQD